MISARDIASSLGAVRSGNGWKARCPAHDDRTPSLSICEGEGGRALVRCHAGCEQQTVIEALKSQGLWEQTLPHSRPVRRQLTDREGTTARRELARELWDKALPVAGSIAQTYLRARGIEISPPRSLRFAPKVKHAPSGQSFPCLIAAVEGEDGKLIAVQRTYLAPDGTRKADIEKSAQKMTLGSCKGGAVRLAEAGPSLGICEGIEDGLSVLQSMPSLPVWATIGTSGLRSVVLPDAVQEVIILADADFAGENASHSAAQRLLAEGRTVSIARPPDPFKDFNDTLLGKITAKE